MVVFRTIAFSQIGVVLFNNRQVGLFIRLQATPMLFTCRLLQCLGLLHILKKMGGMVSVLLRYLFIVDHKHVRVHSGNVSVRPAEDLKCSINDFIC